MRGVKVTVKLEGLEGLDPDQRAMLEDWVGAYGETLEALRGDLEGALEEEAAGLLSHIGEGGAA